MPLPVPAQPKIEPSEIQLSSVSPLPLPVAQPEPIRGTGPLAIVSYRESRAIPAALP